MQPTLVSSKISKAPLVGLVCCLRPFLPIPGGNRDAETKAFREFTNMKCFGRSFIHLLHCGGSERGNLDQHKIFQGFLPLLLIDLETSEMTDGVWGCVCVCVRVNALGHI